MKISQSFTFVLASFILLCHTFHSCDSGKTKSDLTLTSNKPFSHYLTKADALVKKGLSDSACNMMESARNYFFSISDTLSVAKAIAFLGSEEMSHGHLFLAEKRFTDALKLFQYLNKTYEQSQVLRKYAIVLTRRGENKKSQDYLFQALQFVEHVDSVNDIAPICLNIGNNYADMKQPEDALKYYRRALEVSGRTSSFENQIKVLINMGTIYRKKDPDSAFYCYNKTIDLLKDHPNSRLYVNTMYNIALLYHDQHDLPKAMKIYEDVLKYCISAKVLSGQIRAYRGLAESYYEKGDIPKAIGLMEKALGLSDSTGEYSSSVYYMEKLASYHEKTGNFSKANQMVRKILSLKDSLQKQDKISSFKELEILNQIQHKELEYDRVTKELEAQKTRQWFRLLIIFILGISTIALSWSLYRVYRLLNQRQSAYAVLMTKYEKEKKLADSKQIHHQRNHYVELAGSSGSDVDPLYDELIRYYHEEKPYLDHTLKLETVLTHLNTNEKNLAMCLKNSGEENFSSFTNRYRVEAAKKMMEDPVSHNYKIEYIAQASGFGSRMSFYNAFSQFTGVRPSYFRKYLQTRNN